MNTDRLRFDLADLAEEATPVDLRDRALKTSRRLGIQRAVATSAAVFVMVGAATGTAIALAPRTDGTGPTPADTPSQTVGPVPTATDAAPDPTRTTGPTSTDALVTGAVGELFYGPAPSDGATAATSRLYSWRPGGGEPRQLLSLSTNAALLSAAISPDGKLVAWVGQALDDPALYVANVDGTNRRKILERADGMCWGPTWAPDSRRLMVATVDSAEPYRDRRGVLDLASGDLTEVGKLMGCHSLWSADGSTLAFPDGESGRVVMTDPQGSGQWFIPNLGGRGAQRSSFDVASISPDGSKIALWVRGPGVEAGDAARELDVNAVLDTHTGAEIDLPLGGRKLLQAYFQADGSLVARVRGGADNVLVLISAAGKKISETREPAQFKDMQILQVVD